MTAIVEPTRVEITGKHGYDTAVKIGDHLLPCTRAVLTIEPHDYPSLAVDLPVNGGLVISLNGIVNLGGETREALIAMGWTPPAEPQQ